MAVLLDRRGGGRRRRRVRRRVGRRRGSGGVPGQHRAHPGPAVARAGRERRDGPAVELAHPARDRQPQAGPAAALVLRPEPGEHLLGPLGGDAGTLVGHLEVPPAGPVRSDAVGRFLCTGADDHLAAGGGVPGRVVEEVGHDLGEAGAVRGDDEVGRAHAGREPHLARAEPGLGHGRLHQHGDVDRGDREGRGPALEPAQVEQVADQVAQPLGLGQRALQGLVVGAHDAVDEVLEQGPLRRERGAQLVGDRGEELAALLVGGGEVDGHGVERAGEAPHLVGGGGGDPQGVVPGRHARRGVGHLAERGGHPAGEPLGDPERGRHRHRDGQPRGHRGPVPDLGDQRGGDHAEADEHAELDLDRADRVQRAVGAQRRAGHRGSTA